MVTAKQIINSIKPNLTKAPPQGSTQKGSAGYDNIRDDIEKTKSLREGSVEKVPANNNDIVNKLYADALVSGATGSWTAGSGESVTVVNGLVTSITSATFFILLETDDFILLETGDKIING